MIIPPVTSATPAPAAASVSSGTAGQTAPAPAPPVGNQTAAAPSLLAAARQSAAVMQDGLSALMANVLRANAAGTLPQAVQSAVQKLLSLHISTAKTPDADTIRNALVSSGLFSEAMLAEGLMPNDLKTALGQLAAAAGRWQTQAGNAETAPQPHAANAPPPVRGGQPSGQGVAVPSLPEDADAVLTAKMLAGGSDAALARNSLLQMASMPDPKTPGETRWIFDVPLMTPQGAAVAQLSVSRDSQNSSPETPEPVWRIGLAINIEPLGPVRANLALSGNRTWVTIGADRPESLGKLEKNADWLSDALTAQTLEPEIAFHGSRPKPAQTSPLVDDAT